MILLSKAKIEEIKQECVSLKKSLKVENEEQVLRGGPMDSYKEAAAFSVSKQAKESRIHELELIIRDVKKLPNYIKGRKIVIGKWFSLKNQFGIKRYRLVDPFESDPSKGLISSDSPLGKAVSMKSQNDKIQFNKNLISIINVE